MTARTEAEAARREAEMYYKIAIRVAATESWRAYRTAAEIFGKAEIDARRLEALARQEKETER